MNIQGKVWGETRLLFNKNNVEVHFVDIKKGGYCSKHLHRYKYNRFIVMSGKLKVTIWKDYGTEVLEDVTIVQTTGECTVAPGDYHRFEALEHTQAFEIYWTELSENDIVREDHGGLSEDEKASSLCNAVEGSKGVLYASSFRPSALWEWESAQDSQGCASA
jgi:quercetin dioxygenase-like cupin family protein